MKLGSVVLSEEETRKKENKSDWQHHVWYHTLSFTHTHIHTGGSNPRPLEEEGKLRPPSAPDQCEELVAGFRIFSEDAQHGAGDGFTVHLLDAAHHHAHVTVGARGTQENNNSKYTVYYVYFINNSNYWILSENKGRNESKSQRCWKWKHHRRIVTGGGNWSE